GRVPRRRRQAPVQAPQTPQALLGSAPQRSRARPPPPPPPPPRDGPPLAAPRPARRPGSHGQSAPAHRSRRHARSRPAVVSALGVPWLACGYAPPAASVSSPRLAMVGVAPAPAAVFAQLDALGVVAFALVRLVVPAL